MTVKELVLNLLVLQFDRLSNAAKGLTAAEAAWKPAPERHSIWQIVRHVAHWKEAAISALGGNPLNHDELNRRDWLEVAGDRGAWEGDVERLRGVSEKIVTRVQAMGEADFSRSISWYRESPPLAIANGVVSRATHDAYHAGQIQHLVALQQIPVEEFVMAASRGEINRLERLLEEHPNLIDADSRNGWMALRLATYFGFGETVRFLLDRGANVNAISKNEHRTTALHAAVATRRGELVTLLLERGAGVGIKDAEGRTPLDLAERQGASDIVRLLQQGAATEDPQSSRRAST